MSLFHWIYKLNCLGKPQISYLVKVSIRSIVFRLESEKEVNLSNILGGDGRNKTWSTLISFSAEATWVDATDFCLMVRHHRISSSLICESLFAQFEQSHKLSNGSVRDAQPLT